MRQSLILLAFYCPTLSYPISGARHPFSASLPIFRERLDYPINEMKVATSLSLFFLLAHYDFLFQAHIPSEAEVISTRVFCVPFVGATKAFLVMI